MLKRLKTEMDLRIGVVSVLIGIYLSTILTFHYAPVEVSSAPMLVRALRFLQQGLDSYGFPGLLSAVLLSGFAYITLRQMKDRAEKPHLLLLAISLLFGLLNVLGLMMYHLDDLPFFESRLWGVATVYLVCGWACLFFLIAHWVLQGFTFLHDHAAADAHPPKSRLLSLFTRHPWAVSFCVILLCWLPWMILYYPASMDWDVYRQLCSALELEPFARSNHDPWLASLVLTAFYKLGKLLGSENLGIFLFVLVRNLLIAAIYAHCVALLRKAKLRKGICIAVLLFYAVTPVWGAYAKHAFKDTLAAALFCGYILSLITVILKTRKKELKWTDCIYYCLYSAAAALFRNNPIYAILPATVLLLLFLITKRTDWKKCVAVCLGVLIFFGFNHYIFNYAGIKKGSQSEALSLLFQQTARTVKYHGDEITEEERQSINAILDYNIMKDAYDPLISDPIKRTFKKDTVSEKEMAAYRRTWATMLLKHPDTYLESAIGGSYGYYAFTPKHPDGSGNWNSGMGIFNWIRVHPFNDQHGFDFNYIKGSLPMQDAFHVWCKVWESIPILSLTNTIAAYTWFAILVGFALFRKKKWPELIVIAAIGILFLTCVASPVNDAFRYYSPIAAAAPALLLLLNKEPEKTDE